MGCSVVLLFVCSHTYANTSVAAAGYASANQYPGQYANIEYSGHYGNINDTNIDNNSVYSSNSPAQVLYVYYLEMKYSRRVKRNIHLPLKSLRVEHIYVSYRYIFIQMVSEVLDKIPVTDWTDLCFIVLCFI